MAIKMYDLAGAEAARRFSPFCWRARMALAHKGLAVETVPWRFTERAALAFSGSETVPVIVDGDRSVADSWDIANYLEDTYPDRPTLFGGEVGRGEALFVKYWVERALHPLLAPILIKSVFEHIHDDDKTYFRENREARFGQTLEQLCADPEGARERFRAALAPLRATLAAQPYVSGAAPAFADYILFGVFQWARSVSDLPLLEPDDPVHAWRGRLLGRFDGLAAATLAYDP